jgi:BirA family biotin operon repressor/biotin-[acetyl-CoA-carboxylase] ligase
MGSPPPNQPLHWGTQALWELARPHLPGLSIEVVESIDSTNRELLDRLRGAAQSTARYGGRAADLQPMLLVALQQTHGRGRLGRRWESSAEASLTFSLAMPLARADASGLSLAVGVALAEAIDPANAELGLKWPNDLWRRGPDGGRKLGGILIEGMAVGEHRMLVIGVGLNIQPPPGLDPAEVASVGEFDPHATAPSTLAQVLLPLIQAVQAFERSGFAPFAARFEARDLLRGRWISTTDAALPQALALGVDGDGALQVRAPLHQSANLPADLAGTPPGEAGRLHRIVSGEVSVRALAPVGPAAASNAAPAPG